MASCLCLLQGSKTWLALLVPTFAVFARFSSGFEAFLISITLSALLILSTMFFSKQKPNKGAGDEFSPQQNHQPSVQKNTLISSSCNDLGAASQEETDLKKAVKKDDEQSQDLYSEGESMDQFSSTSSEDHSSDVEWPYNVGQRLDCSDDSISDEEGLIEIAIPSGQFVSPEKDHRLNLKCCKPSQDFWAEMNEEDNLIEIDIYMGSIKL